MKDCAFAEVDVPSSVRHGDGHRGHRRVVGALRVIRHAPWAQLPVDGKVGGRVLRSLPEAVSPSPLN